MDPLGFLTPEIAAMFSQAVQADITQKLFIVGIIWKVMGRKVSKHFQSMETAVLGVSAEVKNLRDAVQADFRVQSARLEKVENTVMDVKHRVIKLEENNPKQGG